MVDERTIELINGAIDKVLSVDDQAELSSRLNQSAEAQQYYAEHQELDEILTALPAQEPDADLHQQIAESIRLPASVSPISKRGTSVAPAFFRYGLAAAAGVLLAVGIYETRTDHPGQQDFSQMMGTMAPGAKRTKQLDSFSIDEPGLRSIASLETRNGSTILEVTLDSESEVDISVNFAATGLRVDALGQLQSEFESFHIAGQMIQIRSQGRQRFTVLLRRNSDKAPDGKEVVTLDYSRNGSLIQRSTLSPG